MADLKKLDKVVDQLVVQSNKLDGFVEIYAEIDKLKTDLEANINSFGSSSEKLDKASDSLNEKTQELTDKLTEIQGAIMQRVDSIETSNIKNHTELQNKVKEHTAKLSEIQGSLMQRVDLIEESNKKFQREFDSSIVTRLDKLKDSIETKTREVTDEAATKLENNLYKSFGKEIITKVNTLIGFVLLLIFATFIVNKDLFLSFFN